MKTIIVIVLEVSLQCQTCIMTLYDNLSSISIVNMFKKYVQNIIYLIYIYKTDTNNNTKIMIILYKYLLRNML